MIDDALDEVLSHTVVYSEGPAVDSMNFAEVDVSDVFTVLRGRLFKRQYLIFCFESLSCSIYLAYLI
jgi:hypothetical protein